MTLLDEMEKKQQKQQQRQKRRLREVRTPSSSLEPDSERGYAILVSVALFAVNVTLSTLARAQYGQDVIFSTILLQSLKTLPVFIILVYICHPFNSLIRRAIGFFASVFCGCYIVTLFNTEGYYASMSKVPAIGTIWVWLFIELEWYFGAATLALTYAYTYFRDFSLI